MRILQGWYTITLKIKVLGCSHFASCLIGFILLMFTVPGFIARLPSTPLVVIQYSQICCGGLKAIELRAVIHFLTRDLGSICRLIDFLTESLNKDEIFRSLWSGVTVFLLNPYRTKF